MTTKKKRSKKKARRHNPSRKRRHTAAHAAPRRRRRHRRHNPGGFFAPKRKRRSHKRRRRNPDGIVMDFLVGALGGTAASIGVDLALKKFAPQLDTKTQEAIRIGVGGVAAFALKSKPALGLGIAAAVAAPAARRLITPMLPAQLQGLDGEEGAYLPAMEGVLDPRTLGMGAVVNEADGMGAIVNDMQGFGDDDDDDDDDDFE